ncbi:MAG: hypothetical protein LBF40_08035 [Deltaproteobacteria bacterium]|jgi:hypothetical protein|nr:hypothetical protein [Deltaproteobacteria bacterium]
MTDLNTVPELAAAFAVTTIDNKEGSVGGIYRTVGALSAAKSKVATNGQPTIFPLAGSKLLLSEFDPDEPKPYKLITPESGAKWSAEENPIADLGDLRSVLVLGDSVLGIDAQKHELVKFDSSATPWKIVKTCVYQPVASGATAYGQLLGVLGKHVVAGFNEILKPGTPETAFAPSQLVIVDPEAMAPLSGTLNGAPATTIPVGANATALDVFKAKDSDVYDIFVATAGGRQVVPEGNGENSRLDLVSVKITDKGFEATSKTLLTAEGAGSNNIQSIAISSTNSSAFVLLAKFHSFNEENGKPRFTWDLYSTSVGVLKLLDKAPVGFLGTPVQRNIYDFEEGYVWDVIYNAKNDELWMGHGNDIYIYRLTDRDPWGDPDAFSQEDMNKDIFGNLHSFCVPIEFQDGVLLRGSAVGVGTKGGGVARASSLRDALRHAKK